MNLKKIILLFCALFIAFNLNNIYSKDGKYTVNIQSLIFDDFEMSTDNVPKRYWTLIPDKFGKENNNETGKSLQQIAWVKAWPEAYFGKEGEFFYGSDENSKDKERYKDVSGYCLALNIKFNRQGYNSVELYPVEKKGDKFEIIKVPFKGKVKNIDFWVWGANYDYYIEMVLMDYRGVEHRLDVGSIKHIGWKNFSVEIPSYIPQSVTYIPSSRVLSFVKFIIWTQPHEKVSGASIYIDHIKYLTDVYEDMYDGYQLGKPKNIKKVWDEGVKLPDIPLNKLP